MDTPRPKLESPQLSAVPTSAKPLVTADDATRPPTIEELLDQFNLEGGDAFFGQPEKPKPNEAVAEVVRPNATIRLIGLLAGADVPRRALLKFDEKLVQLSVGEQHDNVELVSINERTVQLRGRDGEWTISLLSQAGLPSQAGSRTADSNRTDRGQRRRRSRTVSVDRLNADDSMLGRVFDERAMPLGDEFGLGDQGRGIGGSELPGLDQMMELPDLPDLDF